MSKEGKKIINLEGLVTYPDGGAEGNWRAKAINFKESMDVSGYEILRIKAKGTQGGEKIKIQLVDNFQEVNSPKGLLEEKFVLSQDCRDIKIPLLEFKKLKVDLKKIFRLAIHYGKEVWGEELNDTNTNKIIVEEIEFD